MLSLLDKYLSDNLKQHTHCMSSDNEYVTLLKYAIHLNIDLSMFPTLWVVFSILLDTQDGKCEYIKCLQEEYCYKVGLGPNCKFIDLLFKRLVITFIKISFLNCFIVSEIIYSQTDTLTEELMYLR